MAPTTTREAKIQPKILFTFSDIFFFLFEGSNIFPITMPYRAKLKYDPIIGSIRIPDKLSGSNMLYAKSPRG